MISAVGVALWLLVRVLLLVFCSIVFRFFRLLFVLFVCLA
jgi:hypothetical protein